MAWGPEWAEEGTGVAKALRSDADVAVPGRPHSHTHTELKML